MSRYQEVLFVQESLLSPVESPQSFSVSRKTENLEVTEGKPERDSPVSVLEPLFMEEDDSPSTSSSRSGTIQQQILSFMRNSLIEQVVVYHVLSYRLPRR